MRKPLVSFELPDVHPSLNVWTRMHWAKRNELKKQWENDAYYSAKQAGLKMIEFPVEIFIEYHHPKTCVDLDNYTPKFILDGLKSLLVDDSIDHIKRLGWEFRKSTTKKTVVTIFKYE